MSWQDQNPHQSATPNHILTHPHADNEKGKQRCVGCGISEGSDEIRRVTNKPVKSGWVCVLLLCMSSFA